MCYLSPTISCFRKINYKKSKNIIKISITLLSFHVLLLPLAICNRLIPLTWSSPPTCTSFPPQPLSILAHIYCSSARLFRVFAELPSISEKCVLPDLPVWTFCLILRFLCQPLVGIFCLISWFWPLPTFELSKAELARLYSFLSLSCFWVKVCHLC